MERFIENTENGESDKSTRKRVMKTIQHTSGDGKTVTIIREDGRHIAVLNTREAAIFLGGISEVTLRKMMKEGEIPHLRVGNSIRFRIVSLINYIEEHSSHEWKRVDGRGRPSKKAD